MRKVELRRFQAAGEDGTIYTVVERQQMTTSRPLSGAPREVGGSIDYVLADGEHLNPNNDGTFTIVQTDEILRPIE